MAKKLSPNEKKSLDSLEQNIDERALAYETEKKKQLKDGKRNELAAELANIDGYLLGCRNGEIADVLPNIQFAHKKASILRALLATK